MKLISLPFNLKPIREQHLARFINGSWEYFFQEGRVFPTGWKVAKIRLLIPHGLCVEVLIKEKLSFVPCLSVGIPCGFSYSFVLCLKCWSYVENDRMYHHLLYWFSKCPHASDSNLNSPCLVIFPLSLSPLQAMLADPKHFFFVLNTVMGKNGFFNSHKFGHVPISSALRSD